jgi:dTDP-4-dehydrorhamnose 3,5-epimerase
VELSAEEGQMLYIPVGFGHGFAALTENVGLAYKVTDYYCPAGERTLVWNDPEIGIEWPIGPEAAILSDKDLKGSTLREAEVFA